MDYLVRKESQMFDSFLFNFLKYGDQLHLKSAVSTIYELSSTCIKNILKYGTLGPGVDCPFLFILSCIYIYSTITYTHIKLDVEAASILLKPGIYRRLLV
jgi:hypothetical protein